jgi:hypothetical protein
MSELSNGTKKHTSKSHETIPLNIVEEAIHGTLTMRPPRPTEAAWTMRPKTKHPMDGASHTVFLRVVIYQIALALLPCTFHLMPTVEHSNAIVQSLDGAH